MKKFRILKSILMCALVAIMCLPLLACNFNNSVVPKKLGKAEGLWLYYGNTRSLSDGSNMTELLTSVIIDGTEYFADEFEINDIAYATDTKEIFYVIVVEKNAYAYHFNYQTQQSGYLCNLKSTKTTIQVSASYILFKSSVEGILFNHNLDCLGNNFVGFSIVYNNESKFAPDSDVIYKVEDSETQTIIYYFNGQKIGTYITYRYARWCWVGDYLYDFYNSKAINIFTGESTQLLGIEDYTYIKSYYNGGVLYVLMFKEDTDEYAYFSFAEGRAHFIFDFGECKFRSLYASGVSMDKFEFIVRGDYEDNEVGVPDDKYYRYNPETGEMKSIHRSQMNFDTDESMQYYQYETNGYTFYLKYRSYDKSFGITPCKWCCYLYRETKKGKKEILQYQLDINFRGRYFYNDICEF